MHYTMDDPSRRWPNGCPIFFVLSEALQDIFPTIEIGIDFKRVSRKKYNSDPDSDTDPDID